MAWEKYYEITQDAEPHKNLEIFLRKNVKPGIAVDLGCGSGRDTVCLIKNGWTVVAFDINNNADYILQKLNDEEKNRFTFVKSSIQEAELPKCDLVVANYSLHYLKKEEFKGVIDKIYDSLNTNGHFISEFLSDKDDWAKVNPNDAFLSWKEFKEVMGNKFELNEIRNFEMDGPTIGGEQKHWHITRVVTRARNKNLVVANVKNKKTEDYER